jgi:hypothetical protein
MNAGMPERAAAPAAVAAVIRWTRRAGAALDVLTDLVIATEKSLGVFRSPIERLTNSEVGATYDTEFSLRQF